MSTTEGQAIAYQDTAPTPPEPPTKTEYPVTEVDAKRLANDFVFHPVKGDQADRYQEIRTLQRTLATLILANCPPSRERSVALTKLEEVGFWANASIARNE
jgi:hypothetical protein